jgi:hypothetical protein
MFKFFEVLEYVQAKNRRTMYAGFFTVVLIVAALSGCAASVTKAKQTASTDCLASRGPNISSVVDAVSNALARGKWRYGYDLEIGNPILIKVGSQLFMVGKFTPPARRAFFELFSVPGLSSPCVDRRNRGSVEYLVIDLPKKIALMADDRSYLFLYPGAPDRKYASELEQLSKIVGKTLVIQVPDASPKNLLEMRKIILHEGAHFFGQERIAHFEPSSPDASQTSRAYVEQLVQTDPEFRESVQNEFCLARELFAGANAKIDADGVAHIETILLQMLDESETRGELFNVGDVESFWYFFEGIPQYLEQLIDSETDPRALQQRYDRLCTAASDVEFSLYFIYLGAAVLHGVDLVSDKKSSEHEFFYFEPDNLLNFRQRTRDFLIAQ